MNKTVEEYLNEVSYKEDDNYVPSLFSLQFINFIKLVNGEQGEEHKTPVIHYKMLDKLQRKSKKNIINMLFRGSAKALALDTIVYTPSGISSIEKINIGDLVLDRFGLPTRVIAKSKIFNKTSYKVILDDHREFIVCEDHLNIVERKGSNNIFKEEVLTIPEILSKGLYFNRTITSKQTTGKEYKWFIPQTPCIQYPKSNFPIDPYTVGVILGDGNIDKNSGYTRIHSHILDVHELISYIPYNISEIKSDKRRPETVRFGLLKLGNLIKTYIGTNNTYLKKIPKELLFGSIEERLEVLRGLMDTDGTISKNKGTNPSFTSVSEELANDVATLVRGLGGRAKITKQYSEKFYSYRVGISISFNPFKLKRKANLWKPKEYKRIGIKSIELIDTVPTQCIAVESKSKSFLINGYTITHNTTLMAEYLILYIATFGEIPGFGKIPLGIYVSDSIENGVKNMRKNLEYRWENSEFLKQVVPITRFTDIRWEFKNAEGISTVFKGYGAKTGVRGTKELGQRPYLALLDDLISDEDARSDTVIKSVEDTVHKAIKFALHPSRSLVIWNGTPFNANDPLYKAIESGVYAVNVFPVCETFPCSKENFKGAWEDRFSYDYVKQAYDDALKLGKIDTFNQELMLRIMSEDDRLIHDSDIRWYKRESVLSNKNIFNFYISTDFATKEKNSNDFSVISVWAYNANGDWFYVDGICKKQTMDKTIDDLFRLVQIYRPQGVGIETNGQQYAFISWLQSEMMRRNIWFTFESNSTEPGIKSSGNKFERFKLVEPWFKLHKFYFPEELKTSEALAEGINELSLISKGGFKSKHDDFCDSISQLAFFNPWKPSESVPIKEDHDRNIWEIDIELPKDNYSSYIV